MENHSVYAAELKTKWDELVAAMERELTLQGRRKNRESEKRVRQLLRSVGGDMYKAYRDASLTDKKNAPKRNA